MSCCNKPHTKPNAEDEPWDPILEPFFQYLISSENGIKTKNAVEVGTKAVEYFRGGDMFKWIGKNRLMLESRFPELFGGLRDSPNFVTAQQIGQRLLMSGFCLKAEHRPLQIDKAAEVKQGDDPAATNALIDNPKWPRRVGITQDQTFDDKGFYVILYEAPNSLRLLMLAGIIAAVFIVCLFPVWPVNLKIGCWYLGVALMSLMFVIIIVRLVLFMACWFGGADFWFLPNFFNEDVGVIDSFKPLYSFEKRQDDALMICARVFLAILSIGLFYKLAETHSISDFGRGAQRGFLDILDWGHQKLSNEPQAEEQKVEIDLSDGERLIQEREKCAKFCEFEDWEELKDFCFSDANCLEDLYASNCWKRCSESVQSELQTAFASAAEAEPSPEVEPAVPEAKDEL